MTFLAPAAAALLAIALHALGCRLPFAPGRHLLFLIIGIVVGAGWLAGAMLDGQGWRRLAAGALLYAFLIEVYLFLTTLTNSVTLRLLADMASPGGDASMLSYTRDSMIRKRLDQMVSSGLLKRQEGAFALTPSGRATARAFERLQRLLRPDVRN